MLAVEREQAGAGQKGVDSRIVRDLMVLSRNRAIAYAFIVSGDDDLREGVLEAQESGVLVALIGVEPLEGLRNQAPTLIQAADDAITLSKDQVSRFITLKKNNRVVAETVKPDKARELGRQFVSSWMGETDATVVAGLLKDYPRIPTEVDARLVGYAKQEMKSTQKLPEQVARELRLGFWDAIRTT